MVPVPPALSVPIIWPGLRACCLWCCIYRVGKRLRSHSWGWAFSRFILGGCICLVPGGGGGRGSQLALHAKKQAVLMGAPVIERVARYLAGWSLLAFLFRLDSILVIWARASPFMTSGEFVTLLTVSRLCHSPGYPPVCFMSSLFTGAVGPNSAFKVNLATAVSCSLAVLGLSSARKLAGNRFL